MKMWFPVATTLWVLLVHRVEGVPMGPWMGIVDKVENCQDDMYKDLRAFFLMTVGKSGKYVRTVTAGSIIAPHGINDNYDMVVRVMETRNSRSDLVSMDKNFGGMCTTLETWIPNIWSILMAQSPLETYSEGSMKCAKPGEGNFTVPFDLPPLIIEKIPTFFYGKYRIDMIVQDTTNQKAVSCTSIFTDAVPRSTKG